MTATTSAKGLARQRHVSVAWIAVSIASWHLGRRCDRA
jgi:hypothetical protein